MQKAGRTGRVVNKSAVPIQIPFLIFMYVYDLGPKIGCNLLRQNILFLRFCQMVMIYCQMVMTDCQMVMTFCQMVMTDCQMVMTRCQMVMRGCE